MSCREIPKRYQKLYQRAMKGKSRKAAMQYFCAECVGFDHSEITKCTDTGCSLYPYRSINEQQKDCHNKVDIAKKQGKIKQKPCEKCGNAKSEAHHPNYDEPLNIIWLCSKCHNQEHRTNLPNSSAQ